MVIMLWFISCWNGLRGTNVNALGDENSAIALTLVSYWKDDGVDRVSVRLEVRGATITTGYKGNALNLAAAFGHVAVVGLLLDWSADINAKGYQWIPGGAENMGTALQAASLLGREAV